MDAVKFTLGGKTAFFKKPDVNSYFYFSYSMIHKVALLGILGAVLGYGGYNRQSGYGRQAARGKGAKKEKTDFPEFYEKLQHLKIAIVPHYHAIEKKIQTFNNSVGYASKEQGGNLIVKEQWLEDPKWDIYIVVDSPEAKLLECALRERRFVYLPYLGKNDHPADISNVELCRDLEEVREHKRIDSLFPGSDFKIVCDEVDYMSDTLWDDSEEEEEMIFKYEEKLPYGLNPETNGYMLKSFFFTNVPIRKIGNTPVHQCGEKTITFI